MFKKEFQNLINYCVTEDGCYLATHEKSVALSLYELKNDFKRLAMIPPYYNLNSLIGTQEYIVLAVEDTRILSYLIVDPTEPTHTTRISQLSTRYLLRMWFILIIN